MCPSISSNQMYCAVPVNVPSARTAVPEEAGAHADQPALPRRGQARRLLHDRHAGALRSGPSPPPPGLLCELKIQIADFLTNAVCSYSERNINVRLMADMELSVVQQSSLMLISNRIHHRRMCHVLHAPLLPLHAVACPSPSAQRPPGLAPPPLPPLLLHLPARGPSHLIPFAPPQPPMFVCRVPQLYNTGPSSTAKREASPSGARSASARPSSTSGRPVWRPSNPPARGPNALLGKIVHMACPDREARVSPASGCFILPVRARARVGGGAG